MRRLCLDELADAVVEDFVVWIAKCAIDKNLDCIDGFYSRQDVRIEQLDIARTLASEIFTNRPHGIRIVDRDERSIGQARLIGLVQLAPPALEADEPVDFSLLVPRSVFEDFDFLRRA